MNLAKSYRGASIQFKDGVLMVSTGRMFRKWRLTPKGLSTISLVYGLNGVEWIKPELQLGCDWHLFGMTEADSSCEVSGMECECVEDDHYTEGHLSFSIEFLYPGQGFFLKYHVRAYPGMPGVWSQISLRSREVVAPEMEGAWRHPSWPLSSYAERLSLAPSDFERIAFGLYNDSQHRYHPDSPILKEERSGLPIKGREIFDWANGLALEDAGGNGLLLVKESHKCVNQDGIDTGAFILHPGDVQVTGLGLTSHYSERKFWLSKDESRTAWANWCLLYDGGALGRQMAIKEFDRARFPFRPERDMLLMANTWGSRGAGELSRSAAEHKNILCEIESCADLGIDLLQIDDGWQFDPGKADYAKADWRPSKLRFPEGWKPIREMAEHLNVSLGLWFSWEAPLELMLQNYREGGFRRFKLDFSIITSREKLDFLVGQAKGILESTDGTVGVNWDVTEQYPRVGYYFAREYGNIFLQNCEIDPPGFKRLRHVYYSPELSLRQIWQLSHYMNLNQVQLSIQDAERIPTEVNNAALYSHDYCFATALMGIPIFFQETHLLSGKARAELIPMIRLYKEHRAGILSGFVFPIGAEPNGASFTGFQCHHPVTEDGYLTVFRENGALEASALLAVNFLRGRRIMLDDLLSGFSKELSVGEDGSIEFTLSEKASFKFLKYTVIQDAK